MTDDDIFHMLNDREITPEQATDLMLEADHEAWMALRPQWFPAFVWAWLEGIA